MTTSLPSTSEGHRMTGHRPRTLGRAGRPRLICLVIAVGVLAGACGGSGSSSGPASGKAASASKPTAVVVDTFMFMPRMLSVHVGDSVTWTNHDDILHTVTSGTREYDPGDAGRVTATHKDGTFDMPLDGKGATATHTFGTAGTFHYFCDRHPGMEADVVVS